MGDLESALALLALLPGRNNDPYDLGSAYGTTGNIMDPYGVYGDDVLVSNSGYMTAPDTVKTGTKGQTKAVAGRAGQGIKDALGTAVGFADDLVTPAAKQAQLSALTRLGGVGTGAGGPLSGLARFAASPKALMLAKVGTGIGALGGVLGAADVLVGKDSAANKIMDTAAMGIGGTLGAVGGPVGIAAGAGIGKAASDGLQWLFGDKKTAEQRKLEEALLLMNGGRI